MNNSIQQGFFKVPKKLLLDKYFKDLSPSSRLIIFYLLSLSNSFQSMVFWQKPIILSHNIGISKITLWRAISELEKVGIKSRKEGKKWSINMIFFYKKFVDSENRNIFISKDRNNFIPSII